MSAPRVDRTLEPDEPPTSASNSGAPMSRVRRETIRGRRVVVKSAQGRGRSVLRREAELLELLHIAALVDTIEVVEDEDRTSLVMEDAGRQTLDQPADATADELLRAVRRCCTAVQELHDAGWSHGAVLPAHVVLGARGRIRLCSLGSARPVDGPDSNAAAEDVSQLLAVIEHVSNLPVTCSGLRECWRWRIRARRLRRIADARRPDPTPPRAADLATSLSAIDAPWSVRVSRHRELRSTRDTPGRPLRTTLIAAAVTASALVAVLGFSDLVGSSPSGVDRGSGEAGHTSAGSISAGPVRTVAPTGRPAPTRCSPWPTVGFDLDGDGCPEDPQITGNIVDVGGTSFRLGATGDLVAIGDWDCNGRATAVLLRPATGELFEFPVWASASMPSQAHPLTIIEGATGVRRGSALPSPGTRASCDRILVALRDGAEIDPLLQPPTEDP